ncbi:DUF1761 domain-containing protein [Candidatus Microgenomates bacterium]|nr:DUF1761 domain-containing protein [Candidatus Microgenomates bacterium]
MQINYLAVFVASVLEFIVGAIWYMPLFGNVWGKIHGFDKVPKAQQKEMQKSMAPYLGVQFIGTIVTTVVLALFLNGYSAWNPYGIAFFMWLGFVVPTQVSAVIFGGTDGKWVVTKIAVMAGGALVCLEVAAAVLHMMG